jgi:hypothetical protein
MADKVVDTTTFNYTKIVANKEKAILFNCDGEKHWIPKSQITKMDDKTKTLTIPTWLYKDKFPNG